MNKIFFGPGDLVTIKHDLPNKPIMLVRTKVQVAIRSEDGSKDHLIGIKCFWFTADNAYQEEVFNTKDLMHVGDYIEVADLPGFLGSTTTERLEKFKQYKKQGITLVQREK